MVHRKLSVAARGHGDEGRMNTLIGAVNLLGDITHCSSALGFQAGEQAKSHNDVLELAFPSTPPLMCTAKLPRVRTDSAALRRIFVVPLPSRSEPPSPSTS